MLKIDPELKALIPPLQQDERAILEQSIQAEGCREKIITWNGLIVDGHNRYEICTKYGIEYETDDRYFEDKDAVKVWMIDNQKGRRNLTDGWKWELAQTRKAILAQRGRENISANRGGTTTLSIIDKEAHNTRDTIAQELGWSTGKVAMADKVWKAADAEVKEKVKAGEVSINQAYQEIKKAEKKAEREEYIQKQKDEIQSGTIKLPEGVFQVVVMDPPWAYGREYDPDTSRVANPYPEMTQDQLLELNPPFDENCILFLWTTHAFIWDAKELMDQWGFTYKATMVWDKQKIGMGAWLRMQCEFCLVGIKGKPIWNNTQWRDIISEPRREHSRKPEIFYQMVEDITVGKRLDFFSREQRTGWEAYGNEKQKF